jgi:hypothetical protein
LQIIVHCGAVAEWFYQQGKIINYDVVDDADVVEDINAVLELRNRKTFEHRRKILDRLDTRVVQHQ